MVAPAPRYPVLFRSDERRLLADQIRLEVWRQKGVYPSRRKALGLLARAERRWPSLVRDARDLLLEASPDADWIIRDIVYYLHGEGLI